MNVAFRCHHLNSLYTVVNIILHTLMPAPTQDYYNIDVRCDYNTSDASNLVVTSLKKSGEVGVECMCSLIYPPIVDGGDGEGINEFVDCTLTVTRCLRHQIPFI